MENPTYEEIYNIVEFAIDDAVIAYDLDERPIMDKTKLHEVITEIIMKREKALRKRLNKQINESVKNILENN
jgi:DNA-binding FadR family transcriptional regulator